jgi:hypothetical protein
MSDKTGIKLGKNRIKTSKLGKFVLKRKMKSR